jgi:hypothetical protein
MRLHAERLNVSVRPVKPIGAHIPKPNDAVLRHADPNYEASSGVQISFAGGAAVWRPDPRLSRKSMLFVTTIQP